MSDPDLERYASALWQKHRAALEFLMERQPDALGQVFRAILSDADNIVHEMESKGIRIELDESTEGVIRFGIKDWDQLPNIHSAEWTRSNRIILLEVTRGTDTIRAWYIIGRGDKDTREWIFNALRKESTLKTNANLAPQWHRVGRQNFYKTLDPDDIDVAAVARECRNKLIAYIERTVPLMTKLFKEGAPST